MGLALQETNASLKLCSHIEMLVLRREIAHKRGIMRAHVGDVAPDS